MTDSPFRLRITATGIGAFLLVLAIVGGVDVGRDQHRQSTARQVQSQKRQLALLGQLELGRAVQDFKDCLLRAASAYCDNFYDHIRAVDRDVSLYRAQSAGNADERQVLDGVNLALVRYESALDEMRDMQRRHATIREIDEVVKGADRPAAQELNLLAATATGPSEGTMPLRSILFLLIAATLAGAFLSMAFGSALPLARPSSAGPRRSPELLARMIAWEEDRRHGLSSRLREDVCQSLIAIKYFLESIQAAAARGVARELPAPVIPSLQAAIRHATDVAQQLEPASAHESGVLATVRALWTEIRVCNPAVAIEARVGLHERDIPEWLAPVILRIARMVAELAVKKMPVSRIAWVLQREDRRLRLLIELSQDDQPLIHASALERLEAIRACAVLSGGSSETVRSVACTALAATWHVDDPASSATH